MANKNLLQSLVGNLLPAESAAACRTSAHAHEVALAQLSVLLELCETADPELVAALAIHTCEHEHLQDVPALLLASLSVRDPALFARTSPRVCDGAQMLRTFAEDVRTGITSREPAGSPVTLLIKSAR